MACAGWRLTQSFTRAGDIGGGAIESNSRSGWHRVRWDGNKSATEAIPAKFLLLKTAAGARETFNESFGTNCGVNPTKNRAKVG
jgi:hypothetical protein